MAIQANSSPNLPLPTVTGTIGDISKYLVSLVRSLIFEFRTTNARANSALVKDGSEAMTGPVLLASYAKASLPTGTAGAVIYVTDDTGGATVAFSDGSNWRRVADRAVIS